MGSYELPFPAGQTYRVSQGNNEETSHHGKARFAFDFAMPEGDAIVAARAGTVARVQESFSACGDSSLANKGNYVLVEHYDDNTADLYLHIVQNSADEFGITPGVTVQQGQKLARAGKVGWTFCGPHLHFQRQEQGRSWWQQSVPVSFDEVPGGVPKHGDMVTSQNAAPTGPEPVPTTLLEALQVASFKEVGLVYHPTDPYFEYAQAHHLGATLGPHFQTTVGPRTYDARVLAADTLFAPIAYPQGYVDTANIQRMSGLLIANSQDPLGLALLEATFKAAGHAFHANWATHQYYLQQLSQRPLGAPLGPVRILQVSGQVYDVEIFALDTLYTLEPNWKDVRRLSDLLADLRQQEPGTPGGL
jgi:murein DD-endopeptidase MepM/ murein hydrolase activator NlpD